MVATQFIIASLIAAASATSLVAREDAYFAALLKRQEPGTPAFDCHDNCGTAITLSRGSDPCNDDAFISDYNACLQCAGPSNFNIWRYYGGTLSTAGAKCGLPTEPGAGAAPSAAPASTSAAAQSSAASSVAPSSAPASSSAAAPTSSEAPATTEAATSEAPVSSAATPSALPTTVVTHEISSAVITSAVISSAPLYPTTIANGTLSFSVSGAPSPSANASASFTASAPAEVTTNAAAGLRAADAAGVIGAVFVGALFGM